MAEELKLFRDLMRVGLADDFIERMAASIGGDLNTPLTSLQAKAIAVIPADPSRANLLVAGPTTAGKTLVATVAAEKVFAATGRRIVYAVPLKAMVVEKTAHLRVTFPGARIISVSADHPRGDHCIGSGAWDMAVVVLDKLYQWLGDAARARQLMENLGLVVVDELQLLTEAERGEKLEITLAILRNAQCRAPELPFGLMALGISQRDAKRVAPWLDASVIPCEETERPVPLYHAVVDSQDSVTFYTDGLHNVDRCEQAPIELISLFSSPLPDSPDAFAAKAVEQGLRVIVYCATQVSLNACADAMKSLLPAAPLRQDVLDRLGDLEESPYVDRLRDLFGAKLGVHARFLSQSERGLTESLFRENGDETPVRAIIATKTLGMGVNLPADVIVFRDLNVGQRKSVGQPANRPLRADEYHNFAGRVGRLTVAASRVRCGVSVCFSRGGDLAHELVSGVPPEIGSALESLRFGPARHILVSLACEEAVRKSPRPVEAMSAILSRTMLPRIEQQRGAPIVAAFQAELTELQGTGFVTEDGLSGRGRGAARYALSRIGAERIAQISNNIEKMWPGGRLALLMQLCSVPEFHFLNRSSIFKFRRMRHYALHCYMNDFMSRSGDLMGSHPLRTWVNMPRRKIKDSLYDMDANGHAELDLLAKAVALYQYASGVPIKRLNDYVAPDNSSEKRMPPSHKKECVLFPYSVVSLAELGNAAEMMHALIGAVRSIHFQSQNSESLGRAEQLQREVWCWEQSIRYGVPVSAVPIAITTAYARNERLSRKSVLSLYAATDEAVDVRGWKGRACPAGVHPGSWEALQFGIDWWNKEAEDWQGSDGPKGLVPQALESLASGACQRRMDEAVDAGGEGRLGAASPVEDSMPRSASIPSGRGIQDVLAEVEKVVHRENKHYEVMELIVRRDLERRPIEARMRPIRRSRDWRVPRWEMRIGAVTAQASLHLGDVAPSDFAGTCEASVKPFIVIVAGKIDDSIVEPPAQCTCVVSAAALVAACRWVQHRPEFRQRLVSRIIGDSAILRTPQEILGIS